MKLNALQSTLLATYAGGEYKNIQRSEDLRDCGDTLLQFLFAELDQDCYDESRDTGIPVMIVASKRLLNAAEEITRLNSVIIGGE